MMAATITVLIISLFGVYTSSVNAVSIISNTDGAAVCPGEELVLTCVAENTAAIRWRIYSSPLSSSFIEKTYTFRDSHHVGIQEVEGVYTFTFVSYANHQFEITLSVTATQSLHNVVAECYSTTLVKSFIITIESTPKHPANISSIVRSYQSFSTVVEVSWSSRLKDDPQVYYYSYELTYRSLMGEPQQAIIGNTSNTSVVLDELPYNSNLFFSLSSINCVGSSSPVTYTINIVGCLEIASILLQLNSNFSQAPGANISLSCVKSPQLQTIAVCQENGTWKPNPYPFSLFCLTTPLDIKTTDSEMSNLTIASFTDDSKISFGTSHIYVFAITSTSASLASFCVLATIVICIYQIRKRRRAISHRNLERQYEVVEDPIYEMVLNESNSKTQSHVQSLSDLNTSCNEAYQKAHSFL